MTQKNDLYEIAVEAYNLIDDIKSYTIQRPYFTDPLTFTDKGCDATTEEWIQAKAIWFEETRIHQKVLMKKLHRLDELLKKLSYEIDPEVDVSFAKTMAKLKQYEQE